MKFDPKNEGIDHINVYSKSKTELGKKLSNFCYSPFFCEDGKFNSIEGYWYWLLCHKSPKRDRDRLKTLSGFAAKKYGKDLKGESDTIKGDGSWFEIKIKAAFDKKLEFNPEIAILLMESDLPLVHYYLYGDDKVISNGRSDWLLSYIEEVRTDLKNAA